MIGGVTAGRISDRFFPSRRPPVALLSYVLLAATATGLFVYLPNVVHGAVGRQALALLEKTPESIRLAWLFAVIFGFMNFSINAVHGLLSGTTAADFGGKKATATAVG